MGFIKKLLGLDESDSGTAKSVRAVFNGAVIAESGQTVVVEGNHYFPPDSLRWEHFEQIEHRTACPWKGTASYYDVVVRGLTLPWARGVML